MSARRARIALAAAALLAACTGGDAAKPALAPAPLPAAVDAQAAPADAGSDADAAELRAEPGPSRYALVGEEIVLDGSASPSAVRYAWDFGDGRRAEGPIAPVAYPKPGRYQAVLTVYDAAGGKRTASAVISVTLPYPFARSESTTVLALPDLGRVAAVSTDSNEVVIVSDRQNGLAEVARFSVAAEPKTLARFGDWLVVVCQGADVLEFLPLGAAPRKKLELGYGARPFGAAAIGSELYVTLAGTGQLARIRADAGDPTIAGLIDGLFDARAVSAIPGGKLAVSRWRSPNDRGVVSIVSGLGAAGAPAVTEIALAFDPQISSDTEIGGVPSYLAQIAVSPTGTEAVVPSLQANIADGTFRNGTALTFQTTLRGIVSFVDLEAQTETRARRKQFDNRGFAGAATYSRRGDYLFVVMPGNRTIERLDVLTEVPSGAIADVGYAPDGVVVGSDDATLYVNVPLSRELVVYDVGAFDTPAPPLARIALVKSEPLAASVLLGKRLFNDSADPRLSRDGYIACAHCHLEGDSDRRVWDFTDRGEGLRNTTSLLGRAGLGDGPLHWSANFDEVQDFEHDIRDAFEGHGLMTNADFQVGTRSQKLGDSKAGVSTELDALAAYVSSLANAPRSPARPGPGLLSAAATRGQTVFENAGCGTCHAGARYTDSAWVSPGVPRLHDVGTLGAGSGKRLGGTLSGIDTPTLRGVFATPPYLHDGSAATLKDVVTVRNAGNLHGSTGGLSAAQIDDLIAFVTSL